MKSFYEKKDIGLIDNFILQEHHLRTKKLHLSKRGNGAFAKRILHFIESWIANINDIFDEIRLRHVLKDRSQSKLSNIRYSGEAKDLAHFRNCNQIH